MISSVVLNDGPRYLLVTNVLNVETVVHQYISPAGIPMHRHRHETPLTCARDWGNLSSSALDLLPRSRLTSTDRQELEVSECSRQYSIRVTHNIDEKISSLRRQRCLK